METKRIASMCITWAMLMTALCSSALALEERAFSEDMKQFGQWIGEGIQQFGEQISAFSLGPKAYLENNESLKELEQAAEQMRKDLVGHWPVLKSSVKDAVEAVFDSELTGEEKADALKEYGVLAIPYLAEIDFEALDENAKASMDALKEFLSTDNEEQIKEWIGQNKQRLQAFKEYLER